ncbi:hypothetical protein GBF38_001660, partial [Nibea albiflora]
QLGLATNVGVGVGNNQSTKPSCDNLKAKDKCQIPVMGIHFHGSPKWRERRVSSYTDLHPTLKYPVMMDGHSQECPVFSA